MRKSTIFISVVISVFVLAMLAGVVSAYQQLAVVPPVVQQVNNPQPVEQNSPVSFPAPSQPTPLGPQEAASIAAKFLGQPDAYSVEMTLFNGGNAYKVTFSSGSLVYVGLDGQVLSVVVPPPQIILASGPSGGSHEGRESESEGHDD